MRRYWSLAVLATLFLVSACGDNDARGYGSSTGRTAAAAAEDDEAAVATAKGRGPMVRVVDSDYGRVIADGKGEAFYLFGSEKGSGSKCYGACAEAWPPVLAKSGGPIAVGGADSELLGTTRRRNGKLQVTYAGNPLYYYVHDTPGEILCHDVAEFGRFWLVVRPNGRPAPDEPALDQQLGDLDGVGRGALAQVVARRPRGRRRARCRGRGGCGRRRRRRGRRRRSPSGSAPRRGRRRRSRRGPRRAARGARSGESGSRVSTLTDSEWPVTTGTRTQVALTRIPSSPRILRVSLISLRSSSVWSSPSAKLPAWGRTLKAIWCG